MKIKRLEYFILPLPVTLTIKASHLTDYTCPVCAPDVSDTFNCAACWEKVCFFESDICLLGFSDARAISRDKTIMDGLQNKARTLEHPNTNMLKTL